MIPYIKVPELTIGPFPIHAFGLLVATGVVVGTTLATRRARMRGLDLDLLNSFITWMLVGGFVAGHVLDEVFYHPDEIARDPLSLLKLWAGLSSFGGFVGAFAGILLWKYFDVAPAGSRRGNGFVRNVTPRPILPFADIILAVFPVAWVFGRAGCASVHDHPGEPASPSSVLAVEFPSHNPGYTGSVAHAHTFGPVTFVPGSLLHGPFPRYDLGLLELMFTILLAAIFALTWRKRLPTGTYVAAAALAYAPARFAMDFLRIREGQDADPRYGSLTPAQWACAALFAYGLYVLRTVLRLHARGIDPTDLVKAHRPSDEHHARVDSPGIDVPSR